MVHTLRSTCCSLGYFLIALGLWIGTRPMQGQTISFFREFSTPQMDRAAAIAADATGVYLFGERAASDGNPGSAGVSKFDSRGNQLWTRPVSAPAPGGLRVIGVASEATGVYAFLAVGDFAQFFIRKYNAEGSSAIVPYAVSGRTSVDVQVEYRGVRSDALTVPVLASRPGIFSVDGSGLGQAAILNEDGSLNSPSNPAQRGSIISIFGTGGGEAAPGVVDGQIVSGVLPRTSLPVSVFFARGPYEQWEQGEVLYAGGTSGSVAGLLQVNVRVALNAAAGDKLPFALIIGSHWELSQVTIALR